MKKPKLLILGIVAVVLFAAYFAVTAISEARSAKDGDNITTESSIAQIGADSIVQISYNYRDNDIVLVRQGDIWEYAADPAFPLDQTKVNSMLSSVENIKARGTLTEPADLSEYGLDKPQCAITLKAEDGSAHTIDIGNFNNLTESYYLVMDGNVGTLWFVDRTLLVAYGKTLDELLEAETLPAMAEIAEVKVESEDKTFALEHISKDSGDSYLTGTEWVLSADGEKKSLDTDKAEDVYELITKLVWESCADYNAKDEDLKQYGLDDPWITATVRYNGADGEKELGILIGDASGKSNYAMIKGSNMVYLIKDSVASDLLGAKYDDMRPKKICNIDTGTITSIDLGVSSKTASLSLDTDNEGNKVYRLNGSVIDTEKAETVITHLTDMEYRKITDDGNTSSDAVLTVKINRSTDTFKSLKYVFYDYDSEYYLAELPDGEARLLIEAARITELLDDIVNLY